MSSEVRVRFAPSPTGPLHIGGVRTALYNYLFARKNGGSFILRIEDTDQGRLVEGAEEYIIESLGWCGIKIDEGPAEGGDYGPYRQSERKELYMEYAEKLVESGSAYYAYDSQEELEALRVNSENRGETFVYNSKTRGGLKNSLALSPEECRKLRDEGVPGVIRLLMPDNEDIAFRDIIRGDIVVNSSALDDKILFKADGMPTYHLANVVDDHLMEISHVIRGEEWLPSLPLHVLLYRFFGWEMPDFAHLPLLLKPTGKGKLSKRDGDKMGYPVFPLFWPYGDTAHGYREDGYFPEAFTNMLAFLGWNPGTEKEIFSMEELIESFSLERVGKSGSRFDPEKAKWFNHQYMQMMPSDRLVADVRKILSGKGIEVVDQKLSLLIDMVKERAFLIPDLWDQSDFFFIAPDEYDHSVIKKKWTDETPRIMLELKAILGGIEDFSSGNTESVVKQWIEEKGYGLGAVLSVFRLVTVGTSRGPHLFDIIAWIGKEETLSRIEKALSKLS